VKQILDNEIYLLIKYIKSVLWRVAKLLSYTEDARCLKVNHENAIGLHTRDNGWGKTYILPKTYVSITALRNFPFFSLFRTSHNSNLRTTLTTQNTTENYTVLSPMQKTLLHLNQMYF